MSSGPYHWCLVPECKNTSVKTPQKLWIQVPSDIKLRNIWLKLARREPKSLSTKTRLYFCEDHFDLENDMENYTMYKLMGSVKRIRMKPNCLPSRFDCQVDRKHKLTPSEPRPAFNKRQQFSTIMEIEETMKNEECDISLPSCSQAMPEEESSATNLESLLNQLDDYTLNVHNYQSIQNALDAENTIRVSVVEKILSICTHDLKEDVKNSVNRLNILFSMLKKIKSMKFTPLPDLVPSAVTVLHILKTTALFKKVEALKTLCFEILMSYPDETLIDITVNHTTELMELFQLYCHQRIPPEIRLKPINIIIKLLKILPPDKKTTFVKEGISIWFSKIIPTVVEVMLTSTLPRLLEALELLSDELVFIDYSDNPHWKVVFQCIYTPQKYPAIIKSLLEKGNENWHRLWIIFIKLLKNQITKSINSIGSPINSMLPVVEMAFKMDVTNRCRAFTCWNVLIDNFSSETNEIYINKRIKLLIIPLTSNNAKVEETAIAKLKTWWHLISCFYPRMDKFSDMVLMPFLNFCFGKSAAPDKPVIIPGMMSKATKVHAAQAFINILGHYNCEGCVTLPKLKGKLISTKMLVSHWRDWIHAVNIVTRTCTENSEFSEKHIKCFWTSFIITVGDLPENNIRRDLFNEVLNLLEKLAETKNIELAEIVLNNIIPTLFNENDKIKALLKSKNEQNAPIQKIVKVILKLPLYNFENKQMVVQKFKVFSNFLIEEVKSSSYMIECILKYLPPRGLPLWIALADKISEFAYTSSPQMFCKMLLWPLMIMDVFVKEKSALPVWVKMYQSLYLTLRLTSINEDIIETLEASNNSNINVFILNMAITILQQKLEMESGSEFVKEADFLHKTISKINNFKEILPLFPSVTGIIVLMLNNLCKKTNNKAGEIVVFIISIILKLCGQAFEDADSNINVFENLEKVFKSFKSFLNEDKQSKLITLPVLLDQLKACAPQLKKQQVLKEEVLGIYKNAYNMYHNKIGIKEIIDAFESDSNSKTGTEATLNQSKEKAGFPAPIGKVAKKQKKKESSIVNTVTENGEEYVVVKSNWKFNPRKLTENQKEKLQQKREDIPALYQDLSQSQDEFKLATWKADSQDTTTTSRSTSEQGYNDVSSILKNIPNSDFVPKILESMLGKDEVENDQNPKPTKENSKIDKNIEEKKQVEANQLQITVSETKSPRLALKDRVFRNVRNLIEKSSLINEVNSSSTENLPKTPSVKSNHTGNLTNSAPTLICVDRPSRLKRKPKKFEDLQVFGIKKRRFSSGVNDSSTDSDVPESNATQTNLYNLLKDTEFPLPNKEKSKSEDNEGDRILNISEEPNNSSIVVNIDEPIEPTVNAETNILEDKSNLNEECLIAPTLSQEKSKMEVMLNEENTENEEKLYLTHEKIIETPCDNQAKSSSSNSKDFDKNISTNVQKSSKKTSSRKSRIEKELAIDMVEGHPFLKVQSEKRLTRKALYNSPCTRKSLSEKSNKNKTDSKAAKSDKKVKDKEKTISVKEVQNTNTEDILTSQDVIESSQESTFTTISVKSAKSTGRKVHLPEKQDSEAETQSLLDDIPNDLNKSNITTTTDFGNISEIINKDISDISNITSKDDTELPRNKTVDENVCIDLTENIDTETFHVEDDVILINDDKDQSAPDNMAEENVKINTQNTAEIDTQSIDPYIFTDEKEIKIPIETVTDLALETYTTTENVTDNDITNASLATTPNDDTKTMSDSVLAIVEKEDLNSPSKGEEQRKKDFLDNTLEISPIKNMSPMREKKSPSPETSSDYVVIKLSSPVQSNGEPFEKIESPEIFTEEKISPDKRDQSPPREEVSVMNTSPSSCLSLKKTRPQVRSGGRAAQMLGLCVPDRLQTIMLSDKSSEGEENKKSPSLNTSARRNLRILYNSSTSETQDNLDEQEDSNNFLKLKRNLPTADCSPSGPILKRKLAEITDEATASPASKRKRVSFHDPPVSTTVCVKKYIEPCGVRSPQNSAIKRQERQLRSQLPMKSPKRLDNAFKLDSVLTKTVESFSESNVTPNTNDDSEISSIEQTPIAQVIKTTDLNDTDSICEELVDCKDPISNIASELSSPAMKILLIKELEEKISTIGDLAKMTELEINRLCIKAPKVEVAKKVLGDYLKKLQKATEEITPTIESALNESIVTENKWSIEVQTEDVNMKNIEMQTDKLLVSNDSTQTDLVSTVNCSSQTHESGTQTTSQVVATCLSERTDFVENLCEKMDENSKKKIVDNLSFNALTDMLMNKLTTINSSYILNKVIEQKIELDMPNEEHKDRRLSIVQDYLCERFDSKELVLFCSDLLKKVYDKP